MMRLQQRLGAIILRDPDVAAMGSQTGSTDSPNPPNTGSFTIVLKPRDQRTASARQVIDRLRPQLARVQGANAFLQPTQDINVGGMRFRNMRDDVGNPWSSNTTGAAAGPASR
jgi:multidrug efflux pump subunit AcrB